MNESKARVAEPSKSVNTLNRQIARFWSYVDKTSSPRGCWLWTGSVDKCGYGYFKFDGKIRRAHRVSWLINKGEITSDKPCILHNCPSKDNPSCVNPAHLWPGTLQENVADAIKKGSLAKGERIWNAKLTDTQVKCIRARKSSGESVISIARDYPVAVKTIQKVLCFSTWRHVI